MTTLLGNNPAGSYGDLLQVSNSNSGVDATARDVSDGDGTASAIKLSTTEIQVPSGKTLTVAGTIDTSSATITGQGPGLVSVQRFTADGTWTKPSGVKFVKVEVIGGGAGGGGVNGQGAGTAGGGSGGGAGGYEVELIDVTGTSSETVTVGAGGAGGVAGANDGTAGGTSSFGAFCQATGGAAGIGRTATSGDNQHSGGLGGTGSGGTANGIGGNGGPGVWFGGAEPLAGAGGNSMYGTGGRTQTADSAGNDGRGFGAGGGGAALDDNGGASAGGDGQDGVVIVWEYE